MIQRDLAGTSLWCRTRYAGRPVGYLSFVGYDEIADHSGIERPETLRAPGAARPAVPPARAGHPRRAAVSPPRRPLRPRPDRRHPLPPAPGQSLRRTWRDRPDRTRPAWRPPPRGTRGGVMLGASVTEASALDGRAACRGAKRPDDKRDDGAVAVGPRPSGGGCSFGAGARPR